MFTAPRHLRGFTLFEVMMAVAIVAIIAGTLLVMVQTMTSSTSDVYQVNNRYDQGLSLMNALRTQFHNLPAQAVILSVEGQSDGNGRGLMISNSPSIFQGDDSSEQTLVTILREEPQPNGQKRLVAVFPKPEDLEGNSARQESLEESKVVLLTNIKSIDWVFYGEKGTHMMETNWVDSVTRPSIIAVELQLSDLLEPINGLFSLPRIIPLSPLPPLGNQPRSLQNTGGNPPAQNAPAPTTPQTTGRQQ